MGVFLLEEEEQWKRKGSKREEDKRKGQRKQEERTRLSEDALLMV